MTDKEIEGVVVLSPVSGTVKSINRGAKRALLEIVIENDKKDSAESFETVKAGDIGKLKSDKATENPAERRHVARYSPKTVFEAR